MIFVEEFFILYVNWVNLGVYFNFINIGINIGVIIVYFVDVDFINRFINVVIKINIIIKGNLVNFIFCKKLVFFIVI